MSRLPVHLLICVVNLVDMRYISSNTLMCGAFHKNIKTPQIHFHLSLTLTSLKECITTNSRTETISKQFSYNHQTVSIMGFTTTLSLTPLAEEHHTIQLK